MSLEFVWGKLASLRVTIIVVADFCMTIEAKRDAVVCRIVATFGYGYDVMKLYLYTAKLLAQAATACAVQQCIVRSLLTKGHVESPWRES